MHQNHARPRTATGQLSARSTWLTFTLFAFVVGCGAGDRRIESSVRYEPPIAHPIVVETVVDLPSDRAWDELIRRLSESSFRVATLEKASRFVSIELQSSSDLAAPANRPTRYIDCGHTTRTFTEDGETEHFEYEVAD